jgi:hypothetical protein
LGVEKPLKNPFRLVGAWLPAGANRQFHNSDAIHSSTLIIAAMLINSYSAGSKLQIASYLTARYAGMRHFGLIYGVIISLVTFGSGLASSIATAACIKLG